MATGIKAAAFLQLRELFLMAAGADWTHWGRAS